MMDSYTTNNDEYHNQNIKVSFISIRQTHSCYLLVMGAKKSP